jgi:MFS family permease
MSELTNQSVGSPADGAAFAWTRRRVLLAGTAAFAAASLGSAFAPNVAVMIITRAAEGLVAGRDTFTSHLVTRW